MNLFDQYVGKVVKIEISGGGEQTVFLVDVGSDVIVFYGEKKYFYIQTVHVKNMEHHTDNKENTNYAPVDPIQLPKQVSFENILNNAKGRFIDVYISDNQTINGYVLSVQQDFMLFGSPLYGTMLIPLYHLKWISPYQSHQTPYSLKQDPFASSVPAVGSLKSTFAEQLHASAGRIVGFDSGLNVKKIGLLQAVEGDFIELTTADEKQRYYNIHHVKNCIYLLK